MGIETLPFRLKIRNLIPNEIESYNHSSFHRHEIIFAKKPILLYFDGMQVTVSAKHIAILPSNVSREIMLKSTDKDDLSESFGYIISISNQYMNSIATSFVETPEIKYIFTEPHLLHYSAKSWHHFIHLIERLDTYLKEIHSDIDRKIIFALASQLFLEIYEILDLSGSDHLTLDEREQLAFQIRNYAEEHLADDIMLKNIASYFQVSQSTINRLFHLYFGSTVYQFILERRLQIAHELIEKGHSISESWQKAGFNDYSNFYRAFIKYFQYRPHETHKFKQKDS